ncbi:MAG: ferrous iron transporter B [Akkermansia sp.]
MKRHIALLGNPNSGKTTLFNELTGSNQYVGNWPGVTVEYKKGQLVDADSIEIIDLPGIYSLSPYSPEEVRTYEYLTSEEPTLILNIVDVTNLERNLYLTTQLLEFGLPVIVALNMVDVAAKRGYKIDIKNLSEELGCPVVEVSALRRTGLIELKKLLAGELPSDPKPMTFNEPLEAAIREVRSHLRCTREQVCKLLQRDARIIEKLQVSDEHKELIEAQIASIESQCGDDMASILASSRYDHIEEVAKATVIKAGEERAHGSMLDRVLTHRVLGLGIFAAIMWCIYYISITTVGDWGTAWANDFVFGPVVGGWLAGFIGDAAAPLESVTLLSALLCMFIIYPASMKRLHDLGFSGNWLYLALLPYLLQYACPQMPEAAHNIVMYVLLAANTGLLALMFFAPGQKKNNDYGRTAPSFKWDLFGGSGRSGRREYIAKFLVLSLISFGIGCLGFLELNCSEQVQSLIGDGIVGGVGAVLGFLPQMAVLFMLLTLLEDCGYMARVAFMMDRIFRTIGLSGKSFIPLLVSMGCGIPGVMATRTIENEKDRRMTIMLTTFVPCGAKLPIIAMIGLLLGQSETVATIAYFAGIGSVILGGLMLRKTKAFSGGYTPFVMELPDYHVPSMSNISMRSMERCTAFVKKAGTVIVIACGTIWATSSYNSSFEYLGEDEIEESMLAVAGNAVAPIFAPLGWGEWKPAVATVTGLVAKEQVLGTFGVLYAGSAAADEPEVAGEEEEEISPEEEFPRTSMLPKYNALSALSMGLLQATQPALNTALPEVAEAEEDEDEEAETRGIVADIKAAGAFTTLSAFSFMLFNLLCAPCFAACGAIRREMNSGLWTMAAIAYMCVWAYIVAFLVFQFGTWGATQKFGIGTGIACLLAAFVFYRLFRKYDSEETLSK